MTWKDHLKNSKDFAADAVKDAGGKASEVAEKAAKGYNESVIKEKIDLVADTTSNQLDVVSGQKMYDLVQENVELQKEINNVLASKLQEALNRVEALEKKINS